MSLLLNAQEIELLSALSRCETRYLVIGGHAVIFHGYLRPAKDLDLWIAPSESNAECVARALLSVHVHLTPAQIERLSRPHAQMPIDRLHTEFLTSVTGLNFEEAFARSSLAIEEGIPCRVLSLADLIECKRRLGRERDLEDIRQLQAAQARSA